MTLLREQLISIGQLLILWRFKVGSDAVQLFNGEGARAILQVLPFLLDLASKFFDAQRLDQNLDTRLVFVIATTVLVVHTHDRFDIGQHMRPRQKLADHTADDRCTTQTTTHQHLKTYLTRCVLY